MSRQHWQSDDSREHITFADVSTEIPPFPGHAKNLASVKKPALKSVTSGQTFQSTSVRTLKSFGHTPAPAAAQEGTPIAIPRTLSFGEDTIMSAAGRGHAQTIEATPTPARQEQRPRWVDPDAGRTPMKRGGGGEGAGGGDGDSGGRDASAFHADMGFSDPFPSSSEPNTGTGHPAAPLLSRSQSPTSFSGASPVTVRGQKGMPIAMATSGGAPKHASPAAGKHKGKRDTEEVTLSWITYPEDDPEGKLDYCGEMKGGKRHGVGMLNWSDGSSYAGQFENGKPHGCGYEKFLDGSIYLGQYKRDCRHGLGRFMMEDGKTFNGQWEDGVQHGVGIELMTIHGVSREIVAVYKRGERVESYVKTEKNSKRLNDDLQKIFEVAALVIQQVQEVTQKVRNTTVGSQMEWENDISQEVERRVDEEIQRMKTADRERQAREEQRQQEMANTEAQPEHTGHAAGHQHHADESVMGTFKHRDISTSHGRVPPTSPWHAIVDEGGLEGTEEELLEMSMEKSRIANEINLVKTLIEQMESELDARRGGTGDRDDDDDADDAYFPGGDAGDEIDPHRRLMTPLKELNIKAPSLSFNPFSHVPGLEGFSRGPPQPLRKRNAPTTLPGPKGPVPLKGIQPGDNSGYNGELVGGMPYGIGQYQDPRTGDYYDGEWVQGLYHGKGRLSKANGITYQGDFVAGLRHGFGVLEWESNPEAFPRYEGAFEQDRKHGAGLEGEARTIVHYVRGCRRKGEESDKIDPRSKAMAAKARSLRERRQRLGVTHPNIIKDLKAGKSVDWNPEEGKMQTMPKGREGDMKSLRWSDKGREGQGSEEGDSIERGGSRRTSSGEEEEEEEEEEGSKEGEGELGWNEFFTRGAATRKGDETTTYGATTDWDGATDGGEVKLIRTTGDDGSEFIGESLNGKPHGLGTIMYRREPPDAEGRVEYAGTFRGGQRHGVGSMLWRDGTNYMGEWKRNRPNGFGFEAYPDGSYYQGTFDNDQRDGVGVYEFPNGLYYSGGWRQGRRYGSGIATDVNKTKYVLTYDRTGKLLTKHQFSNKSSTGSADEAEREVVAEVLRVTLEVRKAAEKARGVAAIELRRRGNIGESAFIHHHKKGTPPDIRGGTGLAPQEGHEWRFQGPQTAISATGLLGPRTPHRLGSAGSALKPGHAKHG